MNDQARQAPPQSDTLPDTPSDNGRRIPIKEVLPLFREAGLPRDIRSLQRYCESGLLDGIKELTATGETWFIAEYSIQAAITQLKQMHNAKGARQATASPDMSRPVASETPNENGRGADGHSATLSDADGFEIEDKSERQSSTGDDSASEMSLLVAQFEKRIADKDGEIAFYREELQERRVQIGDMKGIIDGQNALLEAINRSTAPVFQALAASVRKGAATADKTTLAAHSRALEPENVSDKPTPDNAQQ